MITEAMSTAPETFTIHARNPKWNMEIGGDHISFGTVGSPPNCHDVDGGRRTGNHADFTKFIKMAQHFNAIDFLSGYPVEPIDIHAGIRHLEVLREVSFLTENPSSPIPSVSTASATASKSQGSPVAFPTNSLNVNPPSPQSSTPTRH